MATGGSFGDGGSGGFHTGSLNPGTGGNRDSYDPSQGAAWSQAEYAQETEEEVHGPRRSPLKRIWIAVRRSIWGS
jgi:hypothetical protein